MEDKLVERDGENIELKKQLSTMKCEMEQKLDQLTEFEAEEAALEAALAVPDPDAPAADSAEATAPKKPKR